MIVDVVIVNEIILSGMVKDGWYPWHGIGADPQVRHDRPEPHEINNGGCENWAIKAVELFGGEEVWLDTFKTCADWAHCVVKWQGRYYDSIHPDGARTLREFRRQAREYFQQL